MTRRTIVALTASALCLLLLASPLLAQQKAAGGASEDREAARLALQQAEDLYKAGDYQGCADIVEQSIADSDAGRASFPRRTMARMRVLDALLAYTFRDAGYEERVSQSLKTALTLDLSVEVGEPAEVPPYILERFALIKKEYLAGFTRSARRNTLGFVGAMVLEPTIFTNLSILQPGLFYNFNLSDTLTLASELRVPLQLEIWNSIRGQIGLIWFPTFRVESVSMGISTTYMFGLDNLTTYTHSLSFGGQGEIVSRSGFGVGANVEMLRIDLILGITEPSDLPTYRAIPFLGNLVRVAFANIRMFAFWTF
jgi:hypothetical protein